MIGGEHLPGSAALEPGSVLLMAGGLLGFGGIRRKCA
jgi:hypothetical protein